jgi:toxin ParE1/3/4
MTPVVRKTPRAEQDLLGHYVYIGERDPRAADRFLRAADAAFKRLARLPGMGRAWESPLPRLAGVRSWTIPEFRNFRIFYRPIRNGIEVLHVLYARMDVRRLLEDEAGEDEQGEWAVGSRSNHP